MFQGRVKEQSSEVLRERLQKWGTENENRDKNTEKEVRGWGSLVHS